MLDYSYHFWWNETYSTRVQKQTKIFWVCIRTSALLTYIRYFPEGLWSLSLSENRLHSAMTIVKKKGFHVWSSHENCIWKVRKCNIVGKFLSWYIVQLIQFFVLYQLDSIFSYEKRSEPLLVLTKRPVVRSQLSGFNMS